MMNNFNKLDPEMIHTHILPRLDGTTLTVLSSVSSEFRHMISKNNELWKNICTSTWPYLHHWNLSQIISTFPHGYCSFFSDAFPSLHHHHHHNSSYNFQSQSQSQCIDLPPTKDLIYAIDIYLQGEPHPMLTSTVRSQEKTFLRLYTNRSHTDSHDYFQENFRLNWIVVDPTGKRAGSLCHSSCKPDSVEESLTTTVLMYKMVMPGLPGISTEMVKCLAKVMCYDKGRKGLGAEFQIEDMNGKLVSTEHANIIVMNAIHNGKRKKLC